MDTVDQIPPRLPLQKGGMLLFGIFFLSLTGKEGLGEIFTTVYLFGNRL